MAVKVSFKVGNHFGVRKGAAEDGVEQFMTAVGDDVAAKAENNIRVDTKVLTNELSGRVDRSLQAAVNFAAMNMIGVKSNVRADKSGKAPPTRFSFDWDEPINPTSANINDAYRKATGTFLGSQGSITWKALSSGTLRKKAGDHRASNAKGRPQEAAREFFKHTGELRKELKALASSISKKTGTVRVGYIKNKAKSFNAYRSRQRFVSVGQLRITFVPDLQMRYLRSAQSGNLDDFDPNVMFERSLGISAESIKKLRGVNYVHRPMLQPIFTYWVLNRMPRLVGGAISRAIRTR